MMNSLSTFTRACAHQSLPFRSIPTKSRRQPQLQIHLRNLTTTTQSQAQPIDLTSEVVPSPSDASTLAPSILSYASTDPEPSPKSESQSQTSTTPRAKSPFLLIGTITRTGTMTNTVQLTTQTQTFDKFLQKHYVRPTRVLAHDPNPSGFLREGDVVEYGLFSPAEKQAKEDKRVTLETRLIEKGVIRLRTRKGRERKLEDVGVKKRGPRWVVRRVVGPFGVAVEER